MEISRLSFTKETKEKMNKSLNHFQRGELRWKKLEELQESGELSKARNRMDLVEMIGYPRGYNTGYSWVCNQITRKHLKETLYGFDSAGKMEYEYSLLKTPMFSPADRTKKARDAKKNNAKKTSQATVVPTVVPTVASEVKPVGDTKVVIRYNDLTIELDNIDQTTIEGIIEKLALVSKQ